MPYFTYMYNVTVMFYTFQSLAALQKRQLARQEHYKKYCNSPLYKSQTNNNGVFHRPPSMYVIDKYKSLYCRIPKIGCSNWKKLILYLNTKISSKTALYSPIHNIEYIKFFPQLADAGRYSRKEVIKRLADYFSFVFIRHPLDRLLSAYKDKIVQSNSMTKQRWYYQRKFVPAIIRLCRSSSQAKVKAKTVVESGGGEASSENVTFEEFLCYVTKVRIHQLDKHWAPYERICFFCQPQLNYDFIGEYDYMKEEADFILDLLGVKNVTYPSSNRTNLQRKERFMKAYVQVSNETLNAIRKRYRRDFEMFGYKEYPDFWYT